jgi:hypothetical protein
MSPKVALASSANIVSARHSNALSPIDNQRLHAGEDRCRRASISDTVKSRQAASLCCYLQIAAILRGACGSHRRRANAASNNLYPTAESRISRSNFRVRRSANMATAHGPIFVSNQIRTSLSRRRMQWLQDGAAIFSVLPAAPAAHIRIHMVNGRAPHASVEAEV